MLIGHGSASDQISAYCNENDVDILILGCRGINAFKRAVHGSVGDSCSHNVKCSVMIIKHP
jgi:nucleotide-binding universal stress UspA family protein